MKARIAGLIVRAVRMNFRYQQLFNNSVVGVLQLVAEDLHAYERRLDAADRAGGDGRAAAVAFDRAAYEEEHLDLKPFCRRSLISLSRVVARGRCRARTLLRSRRVAGGVHRKRHRSRGGRSRRGDGEPLQGARAAALHADIFEHLRDSPDASYGGIFAGRVVERLTNRSDRGTVRAGGQKVEAWRHLRRVRD